VEQGSENIKGGEEKGGDGRDWNAYEVLDDRSKRQRWHHHLHRNDKQDGSEKKTKKKQKKKDPNTHGIAIHTKIDDPCDRAQHSKKNIREITS